MTCATCYLRAFLNTGELCCSICLSPATPDQHMPCCTHTPSLTKGPLHLQHEQENGNHNTDAQQQADEER